MYLYRQPIALFGIILPVVATIAALGCCYMLKAKMTESFEHKHKNYRANESSRMAGLEIEAQVTRQHQHIERWNTQLAQETASAAQTTLREISAQLPSKEIQLTAFDPSSTRAGFGAISAQKSSQLRIAFRGTYRTMQRAFLALETRMPQLQLQELRIDPSSNQSSLLNFQVTYTAWEN